MSYPTWDEVAKTNEVSEETLEITKHLGSIDAKMYFQMTLEEARSMYDTFLQQNGPETFDCTSQQITIPSDNPARQPGPITVYTPSSLKGEVPKIVIYIHGGGLIFGSTEGYSKVMQKLAITTGAIVVGLKYRLIPDSGEKYSGLEDCLGSVQWILANKDKVGGKPQSNIGVVGDSAGGQLSILMALEIKGIDYVVAIYPATDYSTTTPSAVEFWDAPFFNSKDIEWVTNYWKVANLDPNDERVIPTLRKDVKGLPPTLIMIAALDPLSSSNVAFGEKLKQAGVDVTVSVYKGLPHGFIGFLDAFPTATQKAFDEIAAFADAH